MTKEKVMKCKFCGKDFAGLSAKQKGGHTTYCKLNPKSKETKQKLSDFNMGKTIIISEQHKEKIRKHHKNGTYDKSKEKQRLNPSFKGKKHTEETKKKISDAARNSKHRRLVKSCRNYIKKDGTIVLLDSSWEEALAIRLDDLNIKWVRPKDPIKYELDNKKHNYFPDFYLPKYDIYLDPKNSYACEVQKDKISILLKNLPNLIIIKTLDECKKYKPL